MNGRSPTREEVDDEINRRKAINDEISKRESSKQFGMETNTLSAVANSPAVNLALGAGDELNKIFSAGHNAPESSSGAAYNLGKFTGGAIPIAAASVLSGGAAIPAGIAAMGAEGALTAKPDQENAWGYLPSGRLGGGLKDALLGTLLAGSAKAAPALWKGTKGAYNYLAPGKDVNKFISNLAGGETTPQSISTLAQRLQLAGQSEKAAALTPKTELTDQYGSGNILRLDKEEMPDINKIASTFTKDKNEHEPWKLLELETAVKKAYKTGDVDQLIEHGERLFPGSEVNEDKLIESLPLTKVNKGSYLNKNDKADPFGDEGLDALHNAYRSNPTFNNADKLQSALSSEIRPLEEQLTNKTLDSSGKLQLKELKAKRESILNDQQKYIDTLPEKYKDLYSDFRSKYREYASKYLDSGKVIRNLSEGNTGGIKQGAVGNKFSGNLSPEMQKIVQDIGPEGQKNILGLHLLNTVKPGFNSGSSLSNAIEAAVRKNGYGNFVTPEIEQAAKSLKRRQYLGYGAAAGLAGASGVGGYLANKIAKIL